MRRNALDLSVKFIFAVTNVLKELQVCRSFTIYLLIMFLKGSVWVDTFFLLVCTLEVSTVREEQMFLKLVGVGRTTFKQQTTKHKSSIT